MPGSAWPFSILLDHGLRGSGSPISQHFSVFHRFFSLFRPPPSPTPTRCHNAQNPFHNRCPTRCLRQTSTVPKPPPKRCQMAHPFHFDIGPLTSDRLIWNIWPDARIPASPKEHEFLSVVAGRQPRGGLITVMRCAPKIAWAPLAMLEAPISIPASYNGYKMRPSNRSALCS